MKPNNKTSKFLSNAISDLCSSELFLHSNLTDTQLAGLYNTFRSSESVKCVPNIIRMFEYGYKWGKHKNIPVCYSRYGFRLEAGYARYVGNYFYDYFEFYGGMFVATDLVKDLVRVIDTHIETLYLHSFGCNLFKGL